MHQWIEKNPEMLNKILTYALILIAVYFYLKLARSPLFKKRRIVNGYEQYRDWWGRWKFTHIYIAEKKVGGKIYKGNVVHHRDGNKLNNSPENLQVMKRWKHARMHYAKRKSSRSRSGFRRPKGG
jgi:hypothetical protein